MPMKSLFPIGLLLATATTELSAGAGSGSYIYHPACGPRVSVPYREVGAEIKRTDADGFTVGLQAAARDDAEDLVELAGPAEEGEDYHIIRSGTRWRLAPYLGWKGQWVRGRLGLVATTYFSPGREDAGELWLLPMASLGVGTERFHVEAGLFDAPFVAPSAEGGLGILSLRANIGFDAGHRLTLGLGGANDEGYLSSSFLAQLTPTLHLGVGGYLGQDSGGSFVLLGTRL